MYPLINGKRKFVLFWNARCACTSLKNWFYFVDKRKDTDVVMVGGNGVVLPSKMIHHVTPYNEYPSSFLIPEYKKIIVTRNPVDRIVSVLGHPILKTLGIERVNKSDRLDDLLSFLETQDMNTDVEHHLNIQSLFTDNLNMHKGPIRQHFDEIIRIEDGPVIPKLNELLGTKVRDMHENISKKDSFEPNEEQIERIKKIYAWDYFHFYPDITGIISSDFYDFYPKEKPRVYRIRFGDTGSDILMVQNHMVAKMVDVKVTGEFDEQTKKAIMAVQAYNGFSQTGELDDETLKAIRSW